MIENTFNRSKTSFFALTSGPEDVKNLIYLKRLSLDKLLFQ